MPLGRQGHNVVYNKLGKPKFASAPSKGHLFKKKMPKGKHMMKGGRMMEDKDMKT